MVGINLGFARFLVAARQAGVNFDETLTIGRQNYYVHVEDSMGLLRGVGHELGFEECKKLLYCGKGYAEPFFHALGARSCDSIDVSAYEHATVIHDLNLPVPEALYERFSAVVDAGSLEHVFNVPTAIRNCMNMVRPGGHLILNAPGNNLMGHGFYQFSPELFYNVLCEGNGFCGTRVMVVENVIPWRFQEARNPAAIRSRVELRNLRETVLFVISKKQKTVDWTNRIPQQSDYTATWDSENPVHRNHLAGFSDALLERRAGYNSLLPRDFKDWLLGAYFSLRDLPLLWSRRRRFRGDWYSEVSPDAFVETTTPRNQD